MALQYITIPGYEAYFGVTAPTNIERLEVNAFYLFDQVTVPIFPTPAEVAETSTECQAGITNAFYEQINYFVQNPATLDEIQTIGDSFSIGKYSESGGSVYGGNPLQRVSPIAWAALKQCYELALTYVGVNNRCFRNS